MTFLHHNFYVCLILEGDLGCPDSGASAFRVSSPYVKNCFISKYLCKEQSFIMKFKYRYKSILTFTPKFNFWENMTLLFWVLFL